MYAATVFWRCPGAFFFFQTFQSTGKEKIRKQHTSNQIISSSIYFCHFAPNDSCLCLSGVIVAYLIILGVHLATYVCMVVHISLYGRTHKCGKNVIMCIYVCARLCVCLCVQACVREVWGCTVCLTTLTICLHGCVCARVCVFACAHARLYNGEGVEELGLKRTRSTSETGRTQSCSCATCKPDYPKNRSVEHNTVTDTQK